MLEKPVFLDPVPNRLQNGQAFGAKGAARVFRRKPHGADGLEGPGLRIRGQPLPPTRRESRALGRSGVAFVQPEVPSRAALPGLRLFLLRGQGLQCRLRVTDRCTLGDSTSGASSDRATSKRSRSRPECASSIRPSDARTSCSSKTSTSRRSPAARCTLSSYPTKVRACLSAYNDLRPGVLLGLRRHLRTGTRQLANPGHFQRSPNQKSSSSETSSSRTKSSHKSAHGRTTRGVSSTATCFSSGFSATRMSIFTPSRGDLSCPKR